MTRRLARERRAARRHQLRRGHGRGAGRWRASSGRAKRRHACLPTPESAISASMSTSARDSDAAPGDERARRRHRRTRLPGGARARCARASGDSCSCDDDLVDLTNLHRQILFDDDDVGQPKLVAARTRTSPAVSWDPHRARSRRGSCRRTLARSFARYDVVLEGADNFATKFLTADACRLEERPVVHASAVRFRATALGRRRTRRALLPLPVRGSAGRRGSAELRGSRA